MTRSRAKLSTPQKGLKTHHRRSQATPVSSSIEASKIADLRSQLARLHDDKAALVNAIERIVAAEQALQDELPVDLRVAIRQADAVVEQLA